MNAGALQREHLAALLAGDLDRAAKLREHLVKPEAREVAVEYLRAATAVCLEYRFGPGAGLGAGPVDHDELTAFMGELRAAGRGSEPPPDYLAVEAVVRALYGEPHLLEALSSEQRSQASFTALCHQLARYKWIGRHPETTIDRAKYLAMLWMGVTPSIE